MNHWSSLWCFVIMTKILLRWGFADISTSTEGWSWGCSEKKTPHTAPALTLHFIYLCWHFSPSGPPSGVKEGGTKTSAKVNELWCQVAAVCGIFFSEDWSNPVQHTCIKDSWMCKYLLINNHERKWDICMWARLQKWLRFIKTENGLEMAL